VWTGTSKRSALDERNFPSGLATFDGGCDRVSTAEYDQVKVSLAHESE
jgi:hypothetical protein